jgi:arginine decarboxylase
LVRRVAERARTPFFSALRAYAAKPTAVFHALPLSRGKGISASQWTGPFWQFFGAGYFSAETSATMPPLDSLFHPVGSLRDAMDFAARAFHSQRTEFCTNGTTGANHIVYRALLQPGDVVLQDRNCHQSHHYAALMSRARVSYLEPHHLDQYGISTLVRLEEIRRQLLRYPKGTVRLLAITHPTFDGVCYDPETIMRLTYEHDPNLVLLFDEAWFAYGAFHPKFKRLSAMCAAEKLWAEGKRVRVYVTQSTHKTLSAMRQGSMIHVRDPLFDDVVKRPFEEALKAMVTTSPNASILASLDVARMQAEMEGYDRIARACSIARWIRSELAEGHCRIRRFRV